MTDTVPPTVRLVWFILLSLIAVGATALWNQLRAPTVDHAAALPEAASPDAAEVVAPAEPPMSAAAAALVDDLMAGRAARGTDGAAPPPGPIAAVPEADVAATSPTAGSASTGPSGEPISLGRDAAIKGATVAPGAIVRLADGSIRADDRFSIRGAGTRTDPYRISWELLGSAAETFQPRLGDTTLPQRVALLDGAWVRIEGHAAFPVYAFDPTEMLMMLNQWDGCCIGVPPTPFDAIEVKLASAPRERRRQIAYFGAVEGVLEIEPYLVENWLVGLYLMDDAKFTLDM